MRHLGWMLSLAVLTLAAAAPLQAQQSRTVRDRVYTAAQAERGADIYGADCAICHGGGATLARAVVTEWGEQAIFEPFEFIRTNMPMTNPGALSRQEYVDIMAYLLKEGGYPAGDAELAVEAQALRDIRIVPAMAH